MNEVPFRLKFVFAMTPMGNVWEAIGRTLAGAVMPSGAIVSAKYNGGCAVTIVFATYACAKAFTYSFFGYTLEGTKEWDVYADEQVTTHMQTGKFMSRAR